MDSLKNKKILLIVTGGISSYKAIELLRLLIKAGTNLECILTKSVSQFVSPITFNSLLGKKVHSELFSVNDENEMNHINLAQKIDLIIIVPATANFIGKIANGIADDLASNVILATKAKVILAPAMNTIMLENKAVKENLNTLKKRGVKVLEAPIGKLACGQTGKGKLMDVQSIFDNIQIFFSQSNLLKGKKAVVTSGPSIENIDPVRYLSNFSSGTQGYEIAKALSNAGAKTTLISGPTKLNKPNNVIFKEVKTGKDFLTASIESLPTDVFISVAAISDWRAKEIAEKKIKKNNFSSSLQLTKNFDVLKEISQNNRRPKLVIGFAAETNDLIKNAQKKLLEKKCDWILANQLSKNLGFGTKKNKIVLLKKNEQDKWPSLEKEVVAKKLVIEISEFFKPNNGIL